MYQKVQVDCRDSSIKFLQVVIEATHMRKPISVAFLLNKLEPDVFSNERSMDDGLRVGFK
jgi:hypothetical protein